MIGKIILGKSFRGCISYCLEDKVRRHKNDALKHHRAEILSFNFCYGNKGELIRQFTDVKNLNPKLSKPVMHITISLAPGERLGRGKLAALVEDIALELGIMRYQYVAIQHSDTVHQHLHIVANRVGFD